jgi:protein transport protein DSL1/ZW10
VVKIEKQMVTRSEGKELTANGPATAADDDWGAAWGDEEEKADNAPEPQISKPATGSEHEDDGADAWGWNEEQDSSKETPEGLKETIEDEDDSAAAWGWGDEDTAEADQEPTTQEPVSSAQEQTRELVLKETYNISSMPEPVLELIFSILEDGALLTGGG